MSMPAVADTRDNEVEGPQLEEQLGRIWATPRGLWGILSTVDHKIIGRRYIVTAFVFLMLGGVLALFMRAQLAGPEGRLVGPDRYNQIFTMHGVNMMFLFAVPVMEAMAVYLVPLMVGTRNIAFPRLNAFSYWIYVAGGILLWLAFALDMGPDVGWFAYVPLAGPQYGSGKRADIWAQMITFTEVSALAVAVEIVVTVFKQRSPGMSLDRIPLFVWSMLVTSFLIIIAMPSIMVASTTLILDRLVGTHFYNPAEGGDVLLYQHLFWFFGHPEVYIIFLPAVGMVSTIVPTFARRPIFGYLPLVLALIATGIMSFGLWVHHMFVAGLPRLGESFFTASSMSIAISAGLQIFCWLATLWSGRPVLKTPLLFVAGFHLHVRDRRIDRRDGCVGALRHTSTRHLLRGGASALCPDRRRRVPAHWCDILLVSQDYRPNDERAAWHRGILAYFRRLQPHVFPNAPAWAARNAPTHLYLSARNAVGWCQLVCQSQFSPSCGRISHLLYRRPAQPAIRYPRRPKSLGGPNLGVGNFIPSPVLQFRPDTACHQRISALG